MDIHLAFVLDNENQKLVWYYCITVVNLLYVIMSNLWFRFWKVSSANRSQAGQSRLRPGTS
jgi:uncharacterized protein affecting Mg2+/Co2+ transport